MSSKSEALVGRVRSKSHVPHTGFDQLINTLPCLARSKWEVLWVLGSWSIEKLSIESKYETVHNVQHNLGKEK